MGDLRRGRHQLLELERKNPRTGQFVKVTARPVPAKQALPGGKYRLVDVGAPLGARQLVYRLTEINQQGARQSFGPFTVAPERGRETVLAKAYTAADKPVSARLARAAGALAAEMSAEVEPLALAAADRGKILIPADGFYRLGAREIANGLGMSVADARNALHQGAFRLSQGGVDVPSEPTSDGDGLLFYATTVHTAYTDNGVAWIERGAGATIATEATTPATGAPAPWFVDTVHAEQDLTLALASATPVDDFFVWKSFFPGYTETDHGEFWVGGLSPSTGAPAKVALHLFGFAATQSARVNVNGRYVGIVTWSGSGPYTATLDIPANALRDGGNAVQIVALTGERGFWLDSIDLTYARKFRAAADRLLLRADPGGSVVVSGFSNKDVAVYDLADAAAPRRLVGGTVTALADGTFGASFVVPAGAGPLYATARRAAFAGYAKPRPLGDLATSAPAAEYLIVSPKALHKEAQRLADARAAQGLSTLLVDQEDVMDAFADGVDDPLAYRRLLAYATANWGVAPRYLLLAGRGSYDPRNLSQPDGGGHLFVSSLLLPYFEATGEGIASADAALADLDGSGVPAVAVGRIPALTSSEMKRFVDKILAYENEGSQGWSPNALLLADNADGGGDFAATSDHIAATAAASPLRLTRQYLAPAADETRVAAARADLWTALHGGQRLFNYVGHGGLDRLATEGLLLSSDVPSLQNGPRLPVMTALTCLITESAYPGFSSLGEELILQPDGGVAALYGPTWLSLNTAAGEFGDHLWPQLTPRTGERLGDRLLRGMQSYAAAGGDRQMFKFYALLGDPALRLKR